MSRVLVRLGFAVRALVRTSRRLLRVLLLALAGAGPPMPAHEIRGRTPAVQHESGPRRQ